MTPIQLAEKEWEANTTPHPKMHRISEFRMEFRKHEFRQYGEAIALLNWPQDCLEIAKLERLPGVGRGATTPLVIFLKSLADKYHIRLSCLVKPYKPDLPWPDDERIPTQEELETWYKKRGFQLLTQEKPAPTWAWYPDIPRIYTDGGSGCLPAD
ncbi:MAG: hypothetical protein ABSD57_05910 [Verrucomicrobiota bacterium]|jgi:hypothetical protein